MRASILIAVLTAGVSREGLGWYWQRISSTPEQGLTLLAASIFAGFSLFVRRPKRGSARDPDSSIPLIAGLLAAYGASSIFAPPLMTSALAIAATFAGVTVAATGAPPSGALIALIIGSMPVLPSLQFTLGYPLRLASSALTASVLQLQGFEVVRQGAMLLWHGQEIQFDAPCSGVNMLLAGLLFTCVIAAAARSTLANLIASLCACAGIMLIFNVMRTVSLFYAEAWGGAPIESWKHSGIGLISFAMALPVLALTVTPGQNDVSGARITPPRRPYLILALSVLIAAAGSIAGKKIGPAHAGSSIEVPVWPAEFDGKLLSELPLTAREQTFARDFPGRIARFTDGEREIIIRWVSRATRQLHPASDCFRALGYSINFLPIKKRSDGTAMGCFLAKREGIRLQVCEQVRNEKGQVWSDVSAWYWAALWNKADMPVWSYAVAEARSQ